MAEEEKTPVEDVDIEEIMQQIREQILARKAADSPSGEPPVKITGRRFPPEFYEHLYQAGLAYDQVQVKMHVSKSGVPVVGPLIQWFRGKLHELVLYYVNQLAARQINVNTHLLRAVNILAEELESPAAETQEAQETGATKDS